MDAFLAEDVDFAGCGRGLVCPYGEERLDGVVGERGDCGGEANLRDLCE